MAIEDSGRQVAGFNGLESGMDSSKEPNLISAKSYALGVNVTSRGGTVKTRPGFVQLDLQADPEDPDALEAFQTGYYQGSTLFTQPANRNEASDLAEAGKGKTYIIAAASGWLFRIDPQTKKIIRLNGTPGVSTSAKAISSITCAGTTATLTTSAPHQLNPGDRVTVSATLQAHLNVTAATILSTPTLNTFTYTANSASSVGSSAGTYTIDSTSVGFINLPKFMDTTYYTLRVASAGKATVGAGLTNSSKVIIEDPLPTGVLLGKTGTDFAASPVTVSGALDYVSVADGGVGFSKNAKAYVVGSTNASLALRFSRDSSSASRPWPDQNHETNRHYFCQAEKFLIIQDGINAPFIFDGENIRRSHITTNPAVSMGVGSGTVVSVLVTNRGSGYTSAPTVTISAPGGAGTTATGTAVISSSSGQVERITVSNAGTSYTSAPTITFSGGGGSGAKAYAILETPSEVPTGSIMAYGQGRLFIANPNRFEIQALDLVGSHVNVKAGTTALGAINYPLSDPRTSVLFNTENTYLNEGGSLLMPSFMGKITGMQFVPTQNTVAGQGQLFVFCEFGAASFAVTTPRSQWGTTSGFQTVLYTNIGAVGPDAFAQVNGDLFFRSNDGLRTYKNATAEMESYGNTAMSAEMNYILNQEPIHLLQDVSLAYTDRGRVLMTALPQEYQPETFNSKSRKVYKALISLDFNAMTGSLGKTAAAYDGIWTGVDILQVIAGDFGRRNRAFILGVSCNLNSVWEIDSKSHEDRPIAGSELTFSNSLLSGTYQLEALAGTTNAKFDLSKIASLGPQNVKLSLRGENESAATTWTSTGMGAQSITVTYAVSSFDVSENTFYSDSRISPFLKTVTVVLPTEASGEVTTEVDLGPINTTGFIYVYAVPVGSLPVNNTSNFTLAVTGSSSGSVPIRAELETSAYSFRSMFELKKLIRADFWFSNLLDQTDVEVYYKPDQYPSWIYWDNFYMLPETAVSIRALSGEKVTKQPFTIVAVQKSSGLLNVTITTETAHGYKVGETVLISGLQTSTAGTTGTVNLSSLNGTYTVLSVSPKTFTYFPNNTAALSTLYGALPKVVSRAGISELNNVDLSKYSARIIRGLAFRLDFETGVNPPGTGASPYHVGLSYLVSSLSPTQVAALTDGTAEYSSFYGSFRTVNVILPTQRIASRFFNLFRPTGNYLYFTISYPSTLPNSTYSVTVTPYGINQIGSTPDIVDTTGFLSTLPNLKSQFAPQMRLMNPSEQADPLTSRMFSHGYDFQGRVVWTGSATLQKMFLHCQTLVEQVGGNI